MLPVLLNLGFFKIYTFGVFAAIALVWGLFVLWKHIKLTSYKEEDIFDCAFISIAIGLIVSRLVFVALSFNTFGFNVLKIILVNGYPGMSLLGFLIGLFVSLYFCFRKLGIETKQAIDYIVTPLLIALSFGKLGSFLSGADVGTKTTFPLSVHFVGYGSIRHVVSFYEAVLFLIGAVIARRVLFAIRQGRLPNSANFFWFLFVFGGVSDLLDKIKQNRLYLGSFSLNLVVGMIFCIVGVAYFIIINRQQIINKMGLLFVKVRTINNERSNTKRNSRNSKKTK